MVKLYYMQHPNGDVIATANPEYWKDHKEISKAKGKALLKQKSVKRLQELLQDTKTVYGIVRHVSASGMQRRIDLYTIKDNAPIYLSGIAANVLDWKLSDKGGVIVRGCGMDMVFHFATSMLSACGIDYQNFRVEML